MHLRSITSPKFPLAILAVLLTLSGQAHSSALECGELKNFSDIGPWDYADPSSSVPTGADPMGRIKRVENVHFKPAMQMLDLKQFNIERLTGEIHYTLRVFPNHPRALYAMSRLERLAGGKLPQNGITPFTPRITADCFFDRALRFRPNDKNVRKVHAMHLQQRGKLKEALAEYEQAELGGEQSADLYYNVGLLHTDLNNWEKAYEYGIKAQNQGFMLPALKQRLEKVGRPLPVQTQPEKKDELKPESEN